MIYLDNAATTMQKPKQVVDAVCEAMCSMGNSGRGAHGASLSASRTIYDTREKLAKFFHASNPKQIAFTLNSTESLNIAIKGILQSGDHVITTVLEHNSVLRPLYQMQEKGVEITFLPCDANGKIESVAFEKAIQENTKAIICTHGSNLTGNLLEIEKIGEIADKYQLLFIVDASQTAGVFPIDVEKMHIDVLCFTGHKGLLGPQGTGGIYVREGLSIRPLKTGGTGIQTYSKTQPVEMPTALEAGTLNAHGIAGLLAALDYIETVGIDETLNIGDYDSAEVSDALLMDYNISTRAGGHCAPLMHKALGTIEQGAVRFSFSHFNTEEEIDKAILAIKELSVD
jgi:cysteine desulfurase family protein